MKVSIVMATYNGENYLREQLDSFLSQTRMPEELIISDDNSDDRTLDIAKEFRQEASFDVKIFENKKNVGYVKNFEKAISKADGDIIFLSDQDDVWFKNKIERILEVFNRDPSPLVVINNQEIVDKDLSSSGMNRFAHLKRIGYSKDKFVAGCCTTFHRSFKPLIIPIPQKNITHDQWINRIAQYLIKRYILEEVLQYYRRHDDTVTNGMVRQTNKISLLTFYKEALSKKVTDYNRKITLLDEIKNRIKNNPPENIDIDEIVRKLEEEKKAWDKRGKLNRYNFFKKRLLMIKMLANGDYSKFNGLRSFFKDFII